MPERFCDTLSSYASYRGGKGHFSFLTHRISGLATGAFLTLHILTTATVFFAPQWYDVLVGMFRNPLIMLLEIVLAFFVVFHGVNGLRIAYVDLFRPELWAKMPTRRAMTGVFAAAVILWLPAAAIMGWALLRHGLGLFGGG